MFHCVAEIAVAAEMDKPPGAVFCGVRKIIVPYVKVAGGICYYDEAPVAKGLAGLFVSVIPVLMFISCVIGLRLFQ